MNKLKLRLFVTRKYPRIFENLHVFLSPSKGYIDFDQDPINSIYSEFVSTEDLN